MREETISLCYLSVSTPPVRDLVVQPNGVWCDSILCVFPTTVMDHAIEFFTHTHCHVILYHNLT